MKDFAFHPGRDPLPDSSSVQISHCENGKLPAQVEIATINACAVEVSQNGKLEIRLSCVPATHAGQSLGKETKLVVSFTETLFREIALDGLRLLDWRRPRPTEFSRD